MFSNSINMAMEFAKNRLNGLITPIKDFLKFFIGVNYVYPNK